VTYTLSDNVENLTLPAAGDNGTGNTLDNVLTGNAGANLLDGGTGNDTHAGRRWATTGLHRRQRGDASPRTSTRATTRSCSGIELRAAANVENLVTLTGSAHQRNGQRPGQHASSATCGDNVHRRRRGADRMRAVSATTPTSWTTPATPRPSNAGEGTDRSSPASATPGRQRREPHADRQRQDLNGTGNTLDNAITGNAGNNRIDGGTGADSDGGRRGQRRLHVDNASDTVTENGRGRRDTIAARRELHARDNVETLVLTGTSAISGTGNAGDNQIIGNSGANTLNGGAGNDVLDGGSGADTLIGGTGNDIFAVDNAGDVVTENAAEGTDTVVASVTYTAGSNVENLVLSGSSAINATGNTGDNLLVGNTGANILNAGAGNDTLNGGGGADSMIGGTGNDTYWVDNAGDTITENASEGTDNVIALVSVTLAANVENAALRDSVRFDSTLKQFITLPTVTVGGDMTMQAWVYLPSSQGMWTRLFDTATPSSDNVIVAFNGTNIMLGTYVGSTGSTTLTSSAAMGTGWHQVSVTIDAQGTSTIYIDGNASGSNTQGVPLDVARTFLVGKSGWTADPYGNYLVNDVRIWDRALTAAEIQANITPGSLAGTETGLVVYQPLNGTLASGLPGGATATYSSGVTYTGNPSVYAGAIDLTGNSLDNNLTGNALANTLTGNSGNNVIDGGAGTDTMAGGAGNDTYIVDNTGDVVTEAASAGTDTIQSSVTYTLPTNVENLVLTGSANINATGAALSGVIAGNTGNNTINGSSSASWLYGGTGTDALVGGTGNDVLISGTRPQAGLFAEYFNNTTFSGSAVTTRYENVNFQTDGSANTGIVNVDGFSVRWTGQLLTHAAGSHQFRIFGDDLMTVTIDGVQIINQTSYTGAQSAPVTVTLTAGYHSIVVTLIDTGGTGAAQLYWQGPNDTSFAIVPLNDLSAAASVNDGTGDTLTGNAGNDLLMGSTGADNMIGGIGNDTYIVDNVGDVVTEAAGAGTDTVQATISYTLGSNVEQLVLAGTSAINGTGNTLANTLTGNSAANVLDGGTGADTMIGGAGNDTYLVDNTADVVTENSNEGTDAVQASVTYTLGANVESLTLTGVSAINGTGNTLANTLTGNTAANVLDGGAGADTMVGGAGNDTYVVDDTGDSVVTENSAEGTDTVRPR
jgi:Ca2+-binding RTX toxin-like protein